MADDGEEAGGGQGSGSDRKVGSLSHLATWLPDYLTRPARLSIGRELAHRYSGLRSLLAYAPYCLRSGGGGEEAHQGGEEARQGGGEGQGDHACAAQQGSE